MFFCQDLDPISCSGNFSVKVYIYILRIGWTCEKPFRKERNVYQIFPLALILILYFYTYTVSDEF